MYSNANHTAVDAARQTLQKRQTQRVRLDLVDEAIREYLATEVLSAAKIEAALDKAIVMLRQIKTTDLLS